LGQDVLGGQLQGFLRTPLHTGGALFAFRAEIADADDLLVRIEGDGAEVAGFKTPAAAVAEVVIDENDTVFLGLRQGFPGAGDDAGGVFAQSAGQRGVRRGEDPNHPDPGSSGIEDLVLLQGAHVLADPAANAFIGNHGHKFVFYHRSVTPSFVSRRSSVHDVHVSLEAQPLDFGLRRHSVFRPASRFVVPIEQDV